MKKQIIYTWLPILLFVATIFLFASCGSDSEDSIPPGSSILKGTKWTTTNWDYSLGSDFVGIHDEVREFLFHSQNEGIYYLGKKDYYSDQGSSTLREAVHFKYTITNNNTVYLEFITEADINLPAYLYLQNNTLTVNSTTFSKSTISSTDTQWINSIKGTTGSCSWYSNLRGKLWIDGEGNMADYNSYNATPWAKNNRTPNKVIINEGVTSIGSYAFANASIGNVEMPSYSLKQIGERAFRDASISNISLSNSITHIGTEAFADCSYLESISIPNNIQEIGEYAFSGTNIDVYELEFGANLRSIEEYAFEGCEASYLTFEEGVETIASGAFIGDFCNVGKELKLPNSLTELGETVFEGSYKKIVIGNGIKEIGEKAFISGATSGTMYINKKTPPTAASAIIAERSSWSAAENRWTLYVPKGSKSTYSKKAPWNKFKSIVEDSSLQGGEEDDDSSSDEESDNNYDVTGSINGYEYVDLGLSVKWATCNVGATKPWEYGGYYAWGETKEKNIYYEPNYLYNGINIGNDISGTKYDVAHVKWGGEWRMPTKAEQNELISNCNWQWTTINDVNGYRVTGPNGNSIFLPATGLYIKNYCQKLNSFGYYWSSEVTTNIYYSDCIRFSDSDYDWDKYYSGALRYDGQTIRPICN